MFAATQTFSVSTATSKTMQAAGGLRNGDLVIAAGAGPACAMIEVTSTPGIGSTVISHAASRFNPGTGNVVAAQGSLYSLGDQPRRNIWSIRNGTTLTVSNDLRYADTNGDGANDWNEVSDGIINMQAQYGIDANNDEMISAAEWTTVNPADWSNVRAIRIALLARSGQYEKAAVPNQASCATNPALDPTSCQRPSWLGGTFTMTNVDGTTDTKSEDPNDWRHYRYRVYETVIPLRNMIWGTIP